jgi:hypothetical protein
VSPAPRHVGVVYLSPGSRADVLIVCMQPGRFELTAADDTDYASGHGDAPPPPTATPGQPAPPSPPGPRPPRPGPGYPFVGGLATVVAAGRPGRPRPRPPKFVAAVSVPIFTLISLQRLLRIAYIRPLQKHILAFTLESQLAARRSGGIQLLLFRWSQGKIAHLFRVRIGFASLRSMGERLGHCIAAIWPIASDTSKISSDTSEMSWCRQLTCRYADAPLRVSDEITSA